MTLMKEALVACIAFLHTDAARTLNIVGTLLNTGVDWALRLGGLPWSGGWCTAMLAHPDRKLHHAGQTRCAGLQVSSVSFGV